MTTTAITYDRFGTPDVLALAEVATPEPDAGQLRISVRAIGVNPFDVKVRRGDFAAMFTPPFPAIPGLEASGVVTALGDGVSGIAIGDEVFGSTVGGAYASDALLSQWQLKPQGIDWEQAAAIPAVGEAAARVIGLLAPAPGETLLVHGAAGSVGSLAVQLAVSRGVRVIGTARADDLEYLASLGAEAVEYGDGFVERVLALAPTGVDAVLDAAGAGVLPASIELAGGAERVVTIADPAAYALGVRFSDGAPGERDESALATLAPLFATGALTLRRAEPRRLADAASVHAGIESGTMRRKVVLLP